MGVTGAFVGKGMLLVPGHILVTQGGREEEGLR